MSGDAPASPGPDTGPPNDGWPPERIAATHNVARFFVENRAVSWVLMIAVIGFGLFGYDSMPKQKDPEIPVRVAVAKTPWPGVEAERIELLVTRPIEEKMAENSDIYPSTPTDFGIQSLTLPGLSIVQVQLDDRLSGEELAVQLNDIDLRLKQLNASLPEGAGPIQWDSGFGETAALMLTIASPPERPVAIDLRARSVADAIRGLRARASSPDERMSVVVMLPRMGDGRALEPAARLAGRRLVSLGLARDPRSLVGPGFAVLDFATSRPKDEMLTAVQDIASRDLHLTRAHPDAWDPVVVRDPDELAAALAKSPGARFTYQELDDASDLVSRQLQAVPQVSKVLRYGVIPRRVEIDYSQDQLVSRDISLRGIATILGQRNEVLGGGRMDASGSEIVVAPSGDFRALDEIGQVQIGQSRTGSPLTLSEVGDLKLSYLSPPTVINTLTHRDGGGTWRRNPAVTLAVQMRTGQQISKFSEQVNVELADLESRLPEELIFARTSDQPRQVEENIDLFMGALYEAILLVVIVALIGFRDWRSSLLLTISIPLTLAMTFGTISLLGVHLQQISIATLIIALGLLVDDPVVASDAIKLELGQGKPADIAAWLGPTKLARAILFATITNVAAYLPFLMLTGTSGEFLWSLPVVMATALISSRIVSMTFLPFLAYHLLRKPTKPEPTMEERRTQGWSGRYYAFVRTCLTHRWLVLGIAVTLMVAGLSTGRNLVTSFFPTDVQYLFTIDVWAPVAYGVPRTDGVAHNVGEIVKDVIAEERQAGRIQGDLVGITTFSGAGGPRFWQTVTPELNQTNYAQLIVEVENKEDTPLIVPLIQDQIDVRIPGAWIDVRQLQLNPVQQPVALLLSSRDDPGDWHSEEDFDTLRRLSDELIDVLRAAPSVVRVRSDWLEERYQVNVEVDPDQANLSGISNVDVAQSIQAAYEGLPVSSLHLGHQDIPVLLRMKAWERPGAHELGTLYVYPSAGGDAVPLDAFSAIVPTLATERVHRREHFRTATIYGFPRAGQLPSQVIAEARPGIEAFREKLPPGYFLQIGGEQYKQEDGFRNMTQVLVVSIVCIFVALVFQLGSLVKPWIVFAGVPFGFAGGVVMLNLTGEPFGFMAFLGLVSLVGVIVSHIIVLNDFIEEMLARGEPLVQSLLDAGLMRLRPVLITVAATLLALFPLARDGGPLWQPLCFAQIGGLAVASLISLLIVPVLYAICALDLKIIDHADRQA